jgi:deazaflavin-dependent oxidoreductase (nitroreductase family)
MIGRFGATVMRTRWFVRAPIWLYRVRLGALFGSRLLMLEHVGRQSGRHRYAVLEVIDHPVASTYVVASGFGGRAQWFRNLEANGQARVSIGSRKPLRANACRLDADAATASMDRYATAHPRAWARLRPVLEHTLGRPVDDCGTELPMIALELVDT